MQVQFLNAPDFVIDLNGTLQRSGSWLLSASPGEDNITDQVLDWAGKIGDAWKEPNTSGDDYTANKSAVVTNITMQALDSSSYKVTFTAAPAFSGSDSSSSDPDSNSSSNSSSSSGGGGIITPAVEIKSSYRFERRKDLCEYKTAKFLAAYSAPEAMPRPGDLINWAGSNYRCESAAAEKQSDGSYIVTLTAVNVAVEPAGRITAEESISQVPCKTGKWLVMPEVLEEFLGANSLHKPAVWAGENYYVSSVETAPADSALRTCVTLKARHAQLQMIENLCTEEIQSMGDGTPETLKVWRSRWQTSAEDAVLFEAMIGTSAENWTGDPEMIVCRVTPKRISDCEFEYQLEARYAETIGSSGKYWRDRDLPDRREYYIRVGEMRLSAIQCGYVWRRGGAYTTINNWPGNQICPLSTTMPLPRNMINQVLKLLEVVEVSYLAGTSSENLASIANWLTAQRVENLTLAKIPGNYLRYDMEVDDVTDSRERQWTKITKVYRMAPAAYNWNSNYWI